MTSLHARDVLTTDVATVTPDTPVAAIARMFADRGISAAAVTDADGTLLGIVTESDIIRRLADEDEQPSGWIARLLESPAAKAERYARSHGVKAGAVMTTELVTVGPEESAAHVAHLMEEHHIRRVLVTQNGRLVGMVTRSDLVRALVSQQLQVAGEPSDEEIHRAVVDEMRKAPWADAALIAVHVKDGTVEFFGYSPSASVSRALRVLAENVPGVKAVVEPTRYWRAREPS
jgi:CBS domain-containing protein